MTHDRWRGIETAPRDGTRILAWRDGQPIIAWWDDDRYGGKQKPYWNGSDGFHRLAWMRVTPPTHWQPIEPPAAHDGETQ